MVNESPEWGPAQSEESEARVARLARGLVLALEEDDRSEIRDWARTLLALRESDLSAVHKARTALAVTRESRIALKVATVVGRRGKELVWTDRSWAARLGLGAALATATAAGGQGAGIAALGSAIGVPLWVVLGAGGTFAGAIIDEVERAFGDTAGPSVSDQEAQRPADSLERVPEADWELISPEEIDQAPADLGLLPPGILGDVATEEVDQAEESRFRVALSSLIEKTRDLRKRRQ